MTAYAFIASRSIIDVLLRPLGGASPYPVDALLLLRIIRSLPWIPVCGYWNHLKAVSWPVRQGFSSIEDNDDQDGLHYRRLRLMLWTNP